MKMIVTEDGEVLMSLKSFVGNVIIELLCPVTEKDEDNFNFSWVGVSDLFKEVREVIRGFPVRSFKNILDKLFLISLVEYSNLQNPFEERKVRLTIDGFGFRGLFKDYKPRMVLKALKVLFPDDERFGGKKVSDCFIRDENKHNRLVDSLGNSVGSNIVSNVCHFYGLVTRSFHHITKGKKRVSCISFHLTHKGLFFLNAYPLIFKV